MENTKTIGEKILSLRKAKGFTQGDLGQSLNVSYQAVSKWERGEACPDFDTISKIARLFNVPISYFESGETELAATAVQAQSAVQADMTEAQAIIGVCLDCGVALKAGEQAEKSSVMRCKVCDARVKRNLEQQARESVQKQEQMEAEKIRARNRGLIWGGVIAGAIFLLGFISAFTDMKTFFDTVLGALILTVFSFTFVSQLFWDGAVVDCALSGCKWMGDLGVIFSFDLDGVIFLIAVKLIWFVLRIFIWLICFVITLILAILISPLTFFFALRRVNREGV